MAACHRRLAATQRWLQKVVIGQRLCPWASPVAQPPRLRLHATEHTAPDELVAEVAREATLLRRGIEAHRGDMSGAAGVLELPETTLLVLSREAAPEYMDLVRLSWRLQAEAILEGGHGAELQLVLFHPLAVHSTYGEGPPDAADYSIRSPYPVVHLLREMDVLAAVSRYPNAAQVPHVNKARLRAIGLAACREQLLACDVEVPCAT
jgi:uncharacterized protein